VNRIPYFVAGAVFAALFSWQSCLLLIREPVHPPAVIEDEDYPLEPGHVWVYKASMGLQVVRRVDPLRVYVTDDPRAKDDFMGSVSGEGYVRMRYELPVLGAKDLLMRRTREGVVARRDNREQLIMRFPMRPGDSWTIDFPSEDLAECTVLAGEAINVLDKRVSASKLRIVRTNRKSGKKTTDYEWYVRGIGLARMEVTFGLKATFELERFEKAK
jgi:hypothetical protein